ncbi:bacteriocin [Clostridia bacterium]|nr:bacteriocin [Clostridia bacterium]
MSISKNNRPFSLFALILVIGAIFFFGTTAYAADVPDVPVQIVGDSAQKTETDAQENIVPVEATLIVKEVWLTGDTLHINVAERGSGDEQILELNLLDYAKPTDEYVTVQATDNKGRTSNSVTFKNPYFEPKSEAEQSNVTSDTTTDKSESAVDDDTNPADESKINSTPFTPDGTGTVLDNTTNENGKEFFTVKTPDGNVFYLIVDRERESDNVYLLNAVNEDDLSSLAKSGDGKTVSAISVPEVTKSPETTETTPTPEPEPAPKKSGSGSLVFIGIAALTVGGAAYYFKIVKPKMGGASEPDYEQDDDFDADEEFDVNSDDEDGDDE